MIIISILFMSNDLLEIKLEKRFRRSMKVADIDNEELSGGLEAVEVFVKD